MASKLTRKKDPIENRRLILAVATQLVAEIGIESLTLEAVAARASLSKGGLLHHFPSKKVLVEELFKQCLHQLSESFQQQLQANPASTPAMAYLRSTLLNLQTPAQRLSMMVLSQAAMTEGYYRQHLHEWYQTHLKTDLTTQSNAKELLIALVTEGLWYADLFDFYELDATKKTWIIHLVEQL